MAVDKLVDSAQLDADLASVANAIRTKGGTSAQLAFPAGFVNAVEAIPTGGGSKGISDKNLLKNAAFSAGYLNGSGVLQAAGSATKEVITNEIDISANMGAKIRICVANSADSFWASLGYYDQNHNWISRSIGITNFSGDLTPPSNAYYIRFMARTYGSAEFDVCFATDWMDVFDGYDPVKVTT